MIKAIKTQQGIIEGVPKEWIRPGAKEKSYNYHREKDEVHFADGWGEVIEVVVNPDIEKKGEVYQIADSNNFTYKLIPLSPEEIAVRDNQAIENKIAMAESEGFEERQKLREVATLEPLKAISDAEAISKQKVFLIWEKQDEKFWFEKDQRYQTVINKELKLVKCNISHTKTIYHPTETPNLFTPVPYPGEIPAWRQPTGAHDVYGMLDKVTHNGFTWESRLASNDTEPQESPFNWWVKI